jgi:hypothetical protein
MDSQTTTSELRRLANRYIWDMRLAEALRFPDRIILRTMDIGTLPDILALERVFGGMALAEILRRAPAGALKPRSWSFWHYRLGLIPPGGRVPPQPLRLVA